MAWRIFLQHGDEKSRTRLRTAGGDPDDPSLLTHELAAEAVDVAAEMLRHFAAVAGAQFIPSDSTWIDPSEVGCCH